jgi:peptidoglycan/LPS O-acetylase OafA/YrhL
MDARPRGASAELARGFVPEIEGLRAFAILAVMLHRFWPQSGPLSRYAHIAELGWMGVDLFFVISGFLIAGILFDSRGQPGYFKNFYARRALRIFPLYYLFVAAVLIVFPLAQGGPYLETEFIRSAGSPLYYLLYLGNVPEMIGYDPPFFLAPVWSLAIEEQFYLLFPLLVAVLSRKAIVWLMVAAVLFAPVFRLGALFIWPDNERVQYLATPSRFDEIALGALLAAALRGLQVRITPRHAHAVLAGAVAVFAIALLSSGLDRTGAFGRVGGYSIVAVTCASVVLWAVVNRRRAGAAALLRWGPLMYVGKLCYGLYLLHRPASFLVDAALARVPLVSPESLWAVAIKVAVAIGLATLSWRLLEQPILRLKDRFVFPDAKKGEPGVPKTDAPVLVAPTPRPNPS